MATAWQTLEEAALTLGISSRTLHRRLARNEFETRLENGRREVLVVIDEMGTVPQVELPKSFRGMADTSAISADTADSGTEMAVEADETTNITDEVSSDVQDTMLALHEDRIRRTDLAIMAYQQSVNVAAADAKRAHRNSRVAFSLAGGLAVAMFLIGIWATHSVTRAKGEVNHLGQVVRQLSDTADAKAREADKFRQDAETARLAEARMEGQLAAVRAQVEQLNQSAHAGAVVIPADRAQTSAEHQPTIAQTGTPTGGASSFEHATDTTADKPADISAEPSTQPAATQPVTALFYLMQRVTLQ